MHFVENGHYLTSQLQDLRQQINAVESSLTMAKARYDRHLSLYSTLSLGRHLGRLMEFFEGMETLLLTKNTPAEEVAFHASYNKASARRVLGAYSLREIRKALEALHLRVIKHFDGQPTLQQTVWRAVQDEFVKASSRWVEYLRQVYPESGADVQLPYSIDDARACFSEVAGTQR